LVSLSLSIISSFTNREREREREDRCPRKKQQHFQKYLLFGFIIIINGPEIRERDTKTFQIFEGEAEADM
jgi:hypothetical protein